MSDTRTKIIDVAERMVRVGGYNGFSFREIAAEIDIKSSSVHYHFPNKEDLALAVAKRYMQNVMDALGDPAPGDATAEMQADRYCQVFQQSFVEAGSACLCGMLSSETALLPPSVKQVLIEFVDANVSWLEQGLGLPTSEARLIYTAMEGAMSTAALKQDVRWVESVSESVKRFVVLAKGES